MTQKAKKNPKNPKNPNDFFYKIEKKKTEMEIFAFCVITFEQIRI